MKAIDSHEENTFEFKTKQSSQKELFKVSVDKVIKKNPLLFLTAWLIVLYFIIYLFRQNRKLINLNLPQQEYHVNKVPGILPLNLPIVKRIEDVIYATVALKEQRTQFQKERNKLIDSINMFPSLSLAKFNLILNKEQKLIGIQTNKNDWNRLNDKFKLSQIKFQLPMCVITSSFNDNANFKIQKNLNSIFLQNYTNYKVIMINDGSINSNGDVYQNYLDFYQIDQKNYVYIQNIKKAASIQNIYKATKQYCPNDSIVVNINSDGQFIGRNVLQVLNWAYQIKKAGVIYSNYFVFDNNKSIKEIQISSYSDKQKKQNLYRNVPMKFHHLLSFQSELIHQINPKDLQDQNNDFYTIGLALYFPLMQLSCGRVYNIQGEHQYLFNTISNSISDQQKQMPVDNRIRKQAKYECYKPFNQKMKMK